MITADSFKGRDPLLVNLSYSESVLRYLESLGAIGSVANQMFSTPQESHLSTPVDEHYQTPYAPRPTDLARLHSLIRSRRATCVLEFGCGYSSALIADALDRNARDFGDLTHFRRSKPFLLHSIDEDSHWIEIARSRIPEQQKLRCSFHQSEVRMTTFNGRICSEYSELPNCSPDLVYLDGPSQFAPKNQICGISTGHPDRVPMACDILKIEHFLLPGCLILVDGRTANARFLKANLQRSWSYWHDEVGDVHFFELIEKPLGQLNEMHLDFCLGEAFWSKIRP